MSYYGLLGERLSHSYSPLIHSQLADYEYRLIEKTPEELSDFLLCGTPNEMFSGLNVTIPYKTAVIPFCKELSDTAKAIGSVNTITRLPDGSLYGDNTDYYGFSHLLQKVNPQAPLTPKLLSDKILILGSGGSSLTVQAVIKSSPCLPNIIVVSRNGVDNYENIDKHSDAAMIINTTPVGMYPNNGVSPIPDLSIFKNCKAVIDLIYNPQRTELLLQAENLNIPNVGGLKMLVAQAKKAAEIFTNTSIPDEKIEEITQKITMQTQNIVLIGMPGCGKSTIGKELAAKLGRELKDTDEWVETKTGKSIPTIFAESGEEAFRKLENEALEELCKQSGLVIATGGGIVKRAENRDIIKQNGIVVFLDRDIKDLPTEGRPLSQRKGVEKLAAERLPLYKKWSDYSIVCQEPVPIVSQASHLRNTSVSPCTREHTVSEIIREIFNEKNSHH